MILAKLTGWGLADILDIESDEFWAWHKAARTVENKIAKALKQGK